MFFRNFVQIDKSVENAEKCTFAIKYVNKNIYSPCSFNTFNDEMPIYTCFCFFCFFPIYMLCPCVRAFFSVCPYSRVYVMLCVSASVICPVCLLLPWPLSFIAVQTGCPVGPELFIYEIKTDLVILYCFQTSLGKDFQGLYELLQVRQVVYLKYYI